ncbi:MAG TPA: TRAP transporter substrate-binding protein [Candidatus Baltobacteraceae bacterium]|nr:TRAP transporter substrate-binding protein [Candidatus Baltobacteraceae bacterium]
MKSSRAAFITSSAAAFASIAVVRSPAKAAQFTGKAGTNQPPDHPLSVAMRDLWDAVRKETNGRVDVSVFPNNQLGGDTAMLTQIRDGALQIMTLDGGILESVVPAAAIQSVGFAFKDSQAAFRAFDGKLGEYVRGEIAAKGLHAFDKIWENGMRQITSSAKQVKNVEDLAGFKMRTPASKEALGLFKSLGAAPTPMNFSELYTALQTRVVDGQENPLANIEFSRFYEVQKYLTLSSHMWGGYWLIANDAWWKSMPPDIQGIVTKNASIYTDRQRRDVMKLNDSLVGKLQSQGMTVNTPDRASMQKKLVASGYYKTTRDEFGGQAWSLLEQYTGKLS